MPRLSGDRQLNANKARACSHALSKALKQINPSKQVNFWINSAESVDAITTAYICLADVATCANASPDCAAAFLEFAVPAKLSKLVSVQWQLLGASGPDMPRSWCFYTLGAAYRWLAGVQFQLAEENNELRIQDMVDQSLPCSAGERPGKVLLCGRSVRPPGELAVKRCTS